MFGGGFSLSLKLSKQKSYKTKLPCDGTIERNGSKISLDGNEPQSGSSSNFQWCHNARSSMVTGPVVNNLDLFGENGEIMPARFERRNSINNLRSSWPPVGSQHRTYNLGFSAAAYEAARYDFTHPNHYDENM